VHTNLAKDGVREQEAKDHLARWPALQVMAEVLIELRVAGVLWWEPLRAGERWGIRQRLGWFEQRPDLREAIARSLTGLTLRNGLRRSVGFQAELIEAVADPIEDAQRVEDAFDPRDLVVYGPVGELWDEAVGRIPWDTELPPALIERLLSVLLSERSFLLGTTRPPILTPWDVRSAIGARPWQAHLPARVRALVDDARLEKELVEPGVPFTARDEIEIVTVGVLATCFPLRALRPVFSAAARIMGLERPAPPHSQPAPVAQFSAVANDADADADVEVTVSTGSSG
jgi:hypothetical protein